MAYSVPLELYQELEQQIGKELVTKAEFLGEMKTLREEMKTLRAEIDLKVERLDRKFTVMFLVLLFTTIFLNKETLSFFLRVIGILK